VILKRLFCFAFVWSDTKQSDPLNTCVNEWTATSLTSNERLNRTERLNIPIPLHESSTWKLKECSHSPPTLIMLPPHRKSPFLSAVHCLK